MDSFERPPLPALVSEQIRDAAYRIDQRYWPLIIEFRVPNFIPPDVPVPTQRPLQFLAVFVSYAKELFEAEAKHYEPFRSDERYTTWLCRISNRISVHLQDVFWKLHKADPKAGLLYQGVSNLRMDADVQRAMSALIEQYTAGQQLAEPNKATGTQDRKAIVDAYFAKFPDVKILDVCWAASQHYREWKRWLRNEIKDGLLPDTALRHVLLSGKRPEQIRKQTRPPKWQ